MLILQGTLRAATTLGGGTNKKTGEVIPLRNVLQVETLDGRGLVAMTTITVPELGKYPRRSAQRSISRCVPGHLAGRKWALCTRRRGRQRDAPFRGPPGTRRGAGRP